MTLKLGYTRGVMGGAKMGVTASPEDSADSKQARLDAFGRALKPLLQGYRCFLGPDMGTTSEDMGVLSAAARTDLQWRARASRGEVYTGLTVLAAATGAAEHMGLRIHGSTLAIEGFGRVGTAVARLFAQKGAKVVAISTARGALYDECGLNVDRLIEFYERVGSRVVDEYGEAQRMARNQLLELAVDVLAPCAGYHSINSHNAARVAAKIVCPGANVPATPDAERTLFERGVVSVPYFVANCGGVLADTMHIAGPSFGRRIIERELAAGVARMLRDAEARAMYVARYAEMIAEERFLSVKEAAESGTGRLRAKASRAGFERYRATPLPDLLIRPFCRRHVGRRMRRL
jgi:glutamate dehydrogenase (NAD(P)+)